MERADENLGRAITQLVEFRSGIPDCRNALREAVKGLESAIAGAGLGPEERTVIQRLRSRAARVQLLLDSATAFYFGWRSAAPDAPPSYAPDGQILRDESGGRLVFRA